MLRLTLFLSTNLAVLMVAGVVLNVLGLGRIIPHSYLDLKTLLMLCAFFGFTGAFISLFISYFQYFFLQSYCIFRNIIVILQRN